MLLAHKSGEKRITSFFTPLFNVIDLQQINLFASRDSLANSREDKLFALTVAGDDSALEKFIKKNIKKLNLDCGVGADTPLILAAKAGHLNVLKVLVKYGAKLDVANEQSFTPLIVAINKQQYNIIQEILKFKHGVNYRTDTDGSTPLHFAVTCNNPKIFICILNASSHQYLTLQNKYQGTVLDAVLRLEDSAHKKHILDALMNKIMFHMLIALLQMEIYINNDSKIPKSAVLIQKASEYYFNFNYTKDTSKNRALINSAWEKTLAYYNSSKFVRTKLYQRYRT